MMARSATQLSTVKVSDIVTENVVAACGDCAEHIVSCRDDYGSWIECDCDAGYATSATIKAIILW